MSTASFLFGLASVAAALKGLSIASLAFITLPQEILAVACGLSSAVFAVGSAVIFHLDRLPDRIARAIATRQPVTPTGLLEAPPPRDDDSSVGFLRRIVRFLNQP